MMSWTVGPDGGPRRVNHAAVTVGDKIYSFGGYCTGEDYRTVRCIDVHVLDTATYKWKVINHQNSDPKAIPFQRYGHTAVVYGPSVYIWGGRNDNNACNTLFCFDTTTHEWYLPQVTGKIPEARDGHSACIINQTMYIFAGYLEPTESYTQDVHALDLQTLTWSYVEALGDAPMYRDFHTATGFDNKMYVWGGREVAGGKYQSKDQEVYSSNLYCFYTVSKRWAVMYTTGDIPKGRRSHSASIYDGHLYVFGGYNSKENQHFNDLHRFDPIKQNWEVVHPSGDGPCPRRRQACCVAGSKLFIFGGTRPNENMENESEGNDDALMDLNDLYLLNFGQV
ncbi:unnamed protein product [Meganyctiphanes norvegica]|uniref:Kelch domain-containing protein 3 n=1 Tax=Meganyctiphanes norvegica TaxID=48144 RepID=A0AAV2Q0Y1_MEGNR